MGLPFSKNDVNKSATPVVLNDVVCVITGGTDGIGASTARLAGKRGATVVISGRSTDKGNKVVADIQADGGKAHFIKTDVTKPEEIKALFAETVNKYGRVDALFNNAGWEGASDSMLEYPVEDLRKLFETNVVGTIVALQEASKMMKQDEDKSRRKVIINNSSIAAALSKHSASSIGWYASTKAAIDSATRVAAGTLQNDGILVYSVNPGAVQTRMADGITKMKALKDAGVDSLDKFAGFNCIGPEKFRLITPEEIGQVVMHMIDGTTKWQTGDCVYIGPGSRTIHMKKLYEQIYADTQDMWVNKVGGLKDGFDESKTIPVPL